jgi:hypothetical protein
LLDKKQMILHTSTHYVMKRVSLYYEQTGQAY